MRRAFTNVGSINPSKLVRRVLSKTSNLSKSSNATGTSNKNINLNKTSSLMDLENELNVLKEQICKLQITVNSMQSDSEKKEQTIANLARDKEKLSLDLKKEKRSNNNLKQQLEDEREFYFREKELYCKEINECKKIKHKLKNQMKNESNNNKTVKLPPENEKELTKLQEALHQTLEANYNLSVKFLRMKNTKYCLKNRLKKLQVDYEKLKVDTEGVVERYKKEMKDLCDRQFTEPIPPSNKMHIQVIKENTSLLHQNLLLRLEIDKLENELEKYKMLDVRKETKKKLRYIRSKSTPPSIQTHSKVVDLKNNNNHSNKHDNVDEIKVKPNESKTIDVSNSSSEKFITEIQKELLISCNDNIDETLEMVQVSDNGSKTSSDTSANDSLHLQEIETQSAPEIIPGLYNTFVNS